MVKHTLVLLAIVGGLILFAMLPDWAWTIQRILWWFTEASYNIGKIPTLEAAITASLVGALLLLKRKS